MIYTTNVVYNDINLTNNNKIQEKSEMYYIIVFAK